MLTDTRADKNNLQSLMLRNMNEERLVHLGQFLRLTLSAAKSACDMHLRWSRDEKQVCFDSVHGGTRQVYVMDVSAAVAT